MPSSYATAYSCTASLSKKISVSIATIARYKAEWRDSQGGNRQAKREAQESAEQHTQSEPINDRLPSEKLEESKTSGQKVELTPEQLRVAAETREAMRRDQVVEAEKKRLVEGLHMIRMVGGTIDGADAARHLSGIETEHVSFLRDWCNKFLAAREKAAA